MTLTELFNLLNSIEGFTGKVAYNSFPENEAPELPFICYLVTNSDNIKADNRVYVKRNVVHVELYSKAKDINAESLIESAFDNSLIPWEKNETYISSESCFWLDTK